MALGEVDYGLMGVVGGLTAFITFLNGVMASGIGRFYAISVGKAQKDPTLGLEECHRWFTTGVVVHTALPLVLMAIGYPLGEWAVRCFLTIPQDRIPACIWVWRCVCVSTFVGMVGVPYSAWYGAKQEIAELTIYSFVTTTLNVLFMYYAVNHPGDWLTSLAVWTMFLSIVPQLIICSRAGLKYPECKFVWGYVKGCLPRVKEMMGYSGWLLIGTLGDLLSSQGLNILVNKYFGPRVNAAMTVANTLSAHSTTLSGSLLGAFWPAVMNSYGACQLERMRYLSYQVCKLGPLFIMIFAIPLALEIHEVIHLWLKHPPAYAAGLCVINLFILVLDRTTHGFAMAMHSIGRIAKYQIVVGGVYLGALPIAWFLFGLGFTVYYLGVAMIIARGGCALMRIVMARNDTGLSMRYWLLHVAIPLFCVAIVTVLVGIIPRFLLETSFARVCITSLLCLVALLVSSWFFLLDAQEKSFVLNKIHVRR